MAEKRKIKYKLVNYKGQEMVATKYVAIDRSKAGELDDLQWVIPHDHQEKLRKEYEAQNEQ